MRVSSNPAIFPKAPSPREALSLLRRLVEMGNHEFWPDAEDLTAEDLHVPVDQLVGHRQVTDAYLLGLAIRNGGKLVTLDRRIRTLLHPASPHQEAVEVIETR